MTLEMSLAAKGFLGFLPGISGGARELSRGRLPKLLASNRPGVKLRDLRTGKHGVDRR